MKIIRLKPTEDQLIRKCKKGDRKAQYSVYQKWCKMMLSVCRRYVKTTEDAEEVLSNGFVKVFNNINSFEGKGSFEGWIRRIMVNEALNYIRYQKNLFVESGEDYLEHSHDTVHDDGDTEELMLLIDRLPIGYRTVFNLYAIEGYGHKEIAEMLDISEGTSKSQLSKARKMLQDRISRNEYLYKP